MKMVKWSLCLLERSPEDKTMQRTSGGGILNDKGDQASFGFSVKVINRRLKPLVDGVQKSQLVYINPSSQSTGRKISSSKSTLTCSTYGMS